MKKKIYKNCISVVSIIMVFAVVFIAIHYSSMSVQAVDSLPGIVNIRNDIYNSESAYNILEIVPDRAAAEVGYLVADQEPLSDVLWDSTNQRWMTWKEYLVNNLETLDTPDKRQDFVSGLATANDARVDTTGTDATKPIKYDTYKEVSADTPGAILLSSGDVTVHGVLVASVSGAGWNASFGRVTDASLSYDQLVADTTTPYYICTGITSITDVADLNALNDAVYVYTGDTTSGLVQSGTAVALKTAYADAKAVTPGSFDLTGYCTATFKQLVAGDYGPEAVTPAPHVYTASSITYMADGAPYILSETSDDEAGHSLVKATTSIYYTGGFTSNEWFKQYVLDIDAAECAAYNVKVTTLTADEASALTAEQLGKYKLIYLNAGTGKYGADSFNYVYGDPSKDLTDSAVKLLFEQICNSKTACIVDYALIGNALIGNAESDDTNTSIYALACMLMQENYRGLLDDGSFDINKLREDRGYILGWYNNIMNKNGYNYVNANVMVLNSKTGNGLFSNFHTTKFTDTVIEEAYMEVQDEITTENLYRGADQASNFAPLDTNIYKSTIVRYVVNFALKRDAVSKTVINVLEIQPAAVEFGDDSTSTSGTDELTPNIVKGWLGLKTSAEKATVTVHITTMTTAEFIGKIEDMNSKYDMIYIGSDIYRMNKNSGNTRTDYTDNTMDGLIYSHVGDLVYTKAQTGGMLDTDYTTSEKTVIKNGIAARYGGNDITIDKYNALVDYLSATYPVVLSNTLYDTTNSRANDYYVDSSSYLYQFIGKKSTSPNMFTVADVEDGDNTTFKFYSNRAKLSIGTKVTSAQVSSVTSGTAFVVPGTINTNDTTNGQVTYITKENGRFYLRYRFTVTNQGAVYDSTRYKAALLIDTNADGKFSEEYETISDVTITKRIDGTVVTNGELIAGEEYVLTRQVPDTYSEVLTWKVEVSQTNNKFIRNNVIGYTKLQDDDLDAAEIKVLQIYKDTYHTGYPLVLSSAIGTKKDASGSNDIYKIYNTLVYGGTYNNVKYDGITDDFNFNFTSMTNSEFNESYRTGKICKRNSSDTSGTIVQSTTDFNLMNYDMLIIGFYEAYNLKEDKDKNAADISIASITGTNGINEFINSGKSVLFAHDTTSFVNVPDYTKVTVQNSSDKVFTGNYADYVWGYTMNKNIRNLVGMDAYGVTLRNTGTIDYTPLSTGVGLSSTQNAVLLGQLTNTVGADGHYTIGLKDLAYTPKSAWATTVPEVQGYSYTMLQSHRTSGKTFRTEMDGAGNVSSAVQVNEGQITTYPYYLGDSISIASTHYQYYQLDMNSDSDGDGETDVVVWYTLSGNKNYTNSPNDVANNYYIYNKGNVTYTGVGHSEPGKTPETTVDEAKLFINTMIAAYNAATKDPTVAIYESGNNQVAVEAFYEYYDQDNNIQLRENSKRVYFAINDMNMVRGSKSVSTSYYVALGSGATVPSGTPTIIYNGQTYMQVSLNTYNSAGAQVNNTSLQCGAIYYVDIPTSTFATAGTQNVNTILIGAQTALNKTSALTGAVQTTYTGVSYNEVDFVQVELFALD